MTLNSSPSGEPFITYPIAVGGTVYIDTSQVSDLDGIQSFVGYKWLVDGVYLSEGRSGTSNPLATGYPIYESDLGTYLQVEYSYIDGLGNLETATSQAIYIRDDDYPDQDSSASLIALGQTVLGSIETEQDVDVFNINLDAGHRYTFKLLGAGAGVGSLEGVIRIGYYDGSNSFSYETNGGGLGGDPQLSFTSTVSGVFSVSVLAQQSIVGGYGLLVSEGPVDDHGYNTETASNILVNQVVDGALEIADDRDYFSVALVGGNRYRIELAGFDGTRAELFQNPTGKVGSFGYVDGNEFEVENVNFTQKLSGVYTFEVGAWFVDFSEKYPLVPGFASYSVKVVQLETISGSERSDVIRGTSSDDSIFSLSGNDKLYGLAGNDYLDGGTGNDSLYGGIGDDVYVVDSVSDSVVEAKNSGTDEVLTGLAGYTLGANVENLTYTGTGNFTGKGTSAANGIAGGVGNDSLDGGAGADTLVGGAGNDTYTVDNVGDEVLEDANGGTDTVLSSVSIGWLAANVENLTLTGSASINATGNELANRLTGNAGANILDGQFGGADTLVGAAGNDTYLVDAEDTIVEVANGGTDTVRAAFRYTLGANLENLVLLGDEALDGTGNGLANALTGNAADNSLDGGLGNDTLDGGAGADTLIGGTGNDTYVIDRDDVLMDSGGVDTVVIAWEYTLPTDIENLVISGAEAFSGYGNALNNLLTGNAASNYLRGGLGDDTLVGGGGDDDYWFDGQDVIIENVSAGNDSVRTEVSAVLPKNVENLLFYGRDHVSGTGNTSGNYIYGNEGNNYLNGLAGSDTVIGGVGRDSLVGGLGDDELRGDEGADTFIFLSSTDSGNTVSTCDIIADFVQGRDIIDLSAIDASTKITGNNAFSWLGTGAIGRSTAGELRFQKYDNAGTANDYTLVIGDTDSDTASEFMVRLTGLYDLTASDFLL